MFSWRKIQTGALMRKRLSLSSLINGFFRWKTCRQFIVSQETSPPTVRSQYPMVKCDLFWKKNLTSLIGSWSDKIIFHKSRDCSNWEEFWRIWRLQLTTCSPLDTISSSKALADALVANTGHKYISSLGFIFSTTRIVSLRNGQGRNRDIWFARAKIWNLKLLSSCDMLLSYNSHFTSSVNFG